MKTKIVIFSILVLILVIVSGCTKIYVCYDGTTEKNPTRCPTVPFPTVPERDAKQAVDRFGGAYAIATGDKFTQVNIYWENRTWYSDILFTNLQTEEVNSIKLRIDGRTSTVSCIEGCEYLNLGSTTE